MRKKFRLVRYGKGDFLILIEWKKRYQIFHYHFQKAHLLYPLGFLAGVILLFSISSFSQALAEKEALKELGGGEFLEKDLQKSEELKDLLLQEEPVFFPSKEEKEAKKIVYKVKEGDTLSEIAKEFNVSVESIAGSSGIRIVDNIRVGQILYIPKKEGFFYQVKKGENLASLLEKYKISWEEFLEENPDIDPDYLEPGVEVFLPGAKPKNLIQGWLIPVRSRIITSGYGWRRYPRRAFHKGIDIRARYAPVRAAKGGRVTFAGWLGGYGKAIVIAHPGGYKTLYAHLSRIYVRRGMYVSQGQVIGRSGNTGYSFGPHLHFEVTRHGRHINPRKILRGLRYARR